MKTPLFTASSIAELGSATLILDSERRHIAEANGAPDAAFIVRACNGHAQLVAALYNLATWIEADARGYCAKELRTESLERHLELARAALTAAQE